MCFIDCVEYRLIRYIGLVFVSISVLKLSAVGFEPGFQSPVFCIPVGSNALQVSYLLVVFYSSAFIVLNLCLQVFSNEARWQIHVSRARNRLLLDD